MKNWKEEITAQRVLALIGFVLIILFVIQNVERAELSFIFFSIKLPFIIWVIILYLLGILTGWALHKKKQLKEDKVEEEKKD